MVKAVSRQVGFDPDECLLELLAKGCKEGLKKRAYVFKFRKHVSNKT
ncbi:hypothetical protein MARINOS108_60066 [Marinoscillum sp. 108]|nr:hypothetical protein MARINOS108_60066 [Marinoscillum sp. 108]